MKVSDYFTPAQHAQLLKPINPARVGRDGKGFSHVEAYEIRAHLNRVVGFARWSADLIDKQLVFEDGKEGRWSVCYLATVRLTIDAPDGTFLATYTEAATGEAKNQPSRGDAHDLAVKTAESQAFKRCAVNLGDNFGLSLYAKGSLAPLVKATLMAPDSGTPAAATEPVDAHITEPLPREGEPADDKRHATPVEPPVPAEPTDRDKDVAKWRAALLKGPGSKAVAPFYARLHMEASKGGWLTALTEDRDGNVVNCGALLNAEQQRARRSA